MEKKTNNLDIHYCPLREYEIEDGECFETVMGVLNENTKSYNEKIRRLFPNCEKICSECKYNKEKEESTQN